MGQVNWKWLIVGVAVGYVGATQLPRFLNR